MKIRVLILISATILFSGCGEKQKPKPQQKYDIDKALGLKSVKKRCIYPKLPIYELPPLQSAKGLTYRELAIKQGIVIGVLRATCNKYELVNRKVNREYNR